MKCIYCFFFLFFLVGSCQTDVPSPSPSPLKLEVPAHEKIRLVFATSDLLDSVGISPALQAVLQPLYAENKFRPFWNTDSIQHATSKAVQTFTTNAFVGGIPPTRYQGLRWNTHPLMDDILTTLVVGSIRSDIQEGVLDSNHVWRNFRLDSFEALKKYQTALQHAQQMDSFLMGFTPPDSNYRFLLAGLRGFIQETVLSDQAYVVPIEKKNAHTDIISESLRNASRALLDRGFEHDSTDIATIRTAVKQFQRKVGVQADGKIGSATAFFLNESNYQRALRICLSLEKWRTWKRYPSSGVWVNLPSFELHYFHADTLRSSHRIVVGTPDHATPEFCSDIRKIVLFPYWNLPHSIATKEVLPALKLTTNYLAKNKIRVFKNKEEIDPETINWKSYSERNFPFRLRQDPGPANSLGIVKFEFANSYSVYVHDTPSKSLFQRPTRAFSHGCIRTENPLQLAQELLVFDGDSTTAKQLDSLVVQGEQTYFLLKKRVPICLRYATVTADRDGILSFHWDLYRRDTPGLESMKKAYRS